MTNRFSARLGALAVMGAIAACAAAAGGSAQPARTQVSGTITADGSSTVGPYTTTAAIGFRRANPGARVTVGISGTGGGFERFCKGETDLANASRPIRYSEAARCEQEDVRYIQFLVANDGLSVVVNRANTWASCVTVEELRKIWDRGSNVDSWNDVRPSFPNVALRLFGPGTDSGTFDFFTEAINGRARQSRSDYQASENDNVLVQGVQGERGGMGYFGYSYYLANRSKLKLLKINSGSGCVAPSAKTVQDRTYRPLSRPLFVYVKRTSFRRPVVAAFVRYLIANEARIAKQAGFIALTKRQLAKAKRQYNTAIGVR